MSFIPICLQHMWCGSTINCRLFQGDILPSHCDRQTHYFINPFGRFRLGNYSRGRLMRSPVTLGSGKSSYLSFNFNDCIEVNCSFLFFILNGVFVFTSKKTKIYHPCQIVLNACTRSSSDDMWLCDCTRESSIMHRLGRSHGGGDRLQRAQGVCVLWSIRIAPLRLLGSSWSSSKASVPAGNVSYTNTAFTDDEASASSIFSLYLQLPRSCGDTRQLGFVVFNLAALRRCTR